MKTIKTIFMLLLATIMAAACSQDEPGTAGEEPGTGTSPTPIILGSITVTPTDPETGQPDSSPATRQAAAEYFWNSDALVIEATRIGETVPDYRTYYYATVDAGTLSWTPAPDRTPLYLEHVTDATGTLTHTFRAECGNSVLCDEQYFPEFLHNADYITGTMTLDVATRTLSTTAPMTRTQVMLRITINKGDGWTAEGYDFLDHMAGASIYIHNADSTRVIVPYIERSTGQTTLTAILPVDQVCTQAGKAPFTIYPDRIAQRNRKHPFILSAALVPVAGHSITITTAYHNTGYFTAPTITLKDWQEVDNTGTELPGYTGI